MATLDQFVVNIRQLSLEGKFNELAQTLTNSTVDHLNKNIQHIDSIIATFTLPEYSMVKLNFIKHKKNNSILVYVGWFTCYYKSTKYTRF
jgi:hypothetical protein